MNPKDVMRALIFAPAWVAELRQSWLGLMELCMFGEVKSSHLGAMAKLRKRVLDVGEKLRSLTADREWIPQPRDRVKNALGSSFNLKDSLLQLEKCAQDVDGGADLAAFSAAMVKLHALIVPQLAALENRWAALLDSQYDEEDADEK